jgi:hypothetical protein
VQYDDVLKGFRRGYSGRQEFLVSLQVFGLTADGGVRVESEIRILHFAVYHELLLYFVHCLFNHERSISP